MKKRTHFIILFFILISKNIMSHDFRTLRYTPNGALRASGKNKSQSLRFKIIASPPARPECFCLQKCIEGCKKYFSYLKYLSISIYFLSHLHKKNYRYKPCNTIEQKNCIQIDSTLFFHPKIRSCFHKVLHTKSVQPIIQLLQETIHPSNFRNTIFVHEIFLLIFTVYKQILLQECKEHDHVLKKTTLTTIVEVGDKINQLPIAEVLSAIDMLMTELPPFLEKYELNSAITWRTWIKKYWWVPPVFGGWFGLKILLNFQQSYYYDYRYGYARPPRLSTDTIITDPELLKITKDKTDQK